MSGSRRGKTVLAFHKITGMRSQLSFSVTLHFTPLLIVLKKVSSR